MAQSFYLNLPRTFQNVALSAYGAKLYKERFLGNTPNEYNDKLIIADTFTKEDFNAQTDRLRAILEHCKKYVPFYSQYLCSVNTNIIKPDDLCTILPIITKADILANADQFVSNDPTIRNALKTANTSGSSGTPLTVKYTDESRRINYRVYSAALKEFGCSYRSKSTTFAGRILYKNPKNRPDRYDFFNRTQYVSSYFISEETISSYVDALNRWQPEFIDTYPSAIVELLKLAKNLNLQFTFRPKIVLTSSENLSTEARAFIEDTLKTRVLDHYGCTEMAINAFSTGDKYYANPRLAVLEMQHVFDDHYEVVTTGLLNFGMPLLRYKIGDLITKSPSESNYVFNSVDGRLDDVIVTPEGKKIGRMDPAFKGVEGISNAQIVQDAVNNIVVFVILDPKQPQAFNSDLLVSNIKERTSQSIDVKIEFVKDIAKSPNGKFRSVISKIKK